MTETDEKFYTEALGDIRAIFRMGKKEPHRYQRRIPITPEALQQTIELNALGENGRPKQSLNKLAKQLRVDPGTLEKAMRAAGQRANKQSYSVTNIKKPLP